MNFDVGTFHFIVHCDQCEFWSWRGQQWNPLFTYFSTKIFKGVNFLFMGFFTFFILCVCESLAVCIKMIRFRNFKVEIIWLYSIELVGLRPVQCSMTWMFFLSDCINKAECCCLLFFLLCFYFTYVETLTYLVNAFIKPLIQISKHK